MNERSSGHSSKRAQRVFGWNPQLEEGRIGEEVAYRWFIHKGRTVVDVRDDPHYRRHDVDFLVDGIGVEVKTDTRAHETGNLYLEFNALRRSTAHYWYFYQKQRDWLFCFNHDDLLAYALAQPAADHRAATTEMDDGRTYEVPGVPVRMTRLLSDLAVGLDTLVLKRIEAAEDGVEDGAVHDED